MVVSRRSRKFLSKVLSIFIISSIMLGYVPSAMFTLGQVGAEVPEETEDVGGEVGVMNTVAPEDELMGEEGALGEELEEEEEGSAGDEVGVVVEETTNNAGISVPIVFTDEADYAPGETVTISGVSFLH